ncbi:MAG: carboxy terminal-processing peptidase [Xanthomonadales bacterium]|nr:carboxy terminal-processing peptidase [Xanthomonadales bacterium]ODU92081.1 MAG: tail-specific protease [Rhodanobacter sp. SCN 66-43]OJY86055.1 MAG: tail-specific protease [Xanthomonadales bacterium 66-474]
MLQRVFVVLIALFVSLGARAQNAAPASTTACPASSASAPAAPVAKYKMTSAPVLEPTAAQGQAAILAARLLTRFQYEALPLDDAMSAKIFDAYFKALDGSKLFFTQADVNQFAPDRDKLDDAIWKGDMSIPFAIFNLYEKRAGERTTYALALLKQGFNLDTDGTYTFDRDKAAWATDTAALDALWKQRVENDWIRLKLAGKDDAEIRKTLSRRYETYLDRVHQLDSEDVFQTFMNAYAMAIDPHTNYFGPRASQNFDITMKLSLEGIGAVLQEHDEYTVIREIVPGGPAAKSGKLEVGDKIVGVGQGECGPIVDTVGWRIDDVVAKIRGHKGTVVRIEILPAEGGPDAKPVIVTVVRKKVTIAEQAAKKKVIDVKEGARTIKVGVIDLPSFYEDFDARRRGDPDYKSASRDVAKLLAELKQQKVSAVVVDLRDNGGGSLSEAVNLSGLFTGKGPVVQVRDSRGQVEEQDSDEKMLWTGPMAVLINRGSASASEIFTAAIQDYGRGLIIGEQTFGKGTVQNLTSLDQLAMNNTPTFGELKMTVAEFFRVDGDSTQLHGVTPDILFPHSIGYKDYGESSYPNALKWTHIPPAEYTAVADQKQLIAPLTAEHDARARTDPAWQLLLDELAAARKLHDQKSVSLNYQVRETERKQQDAQDATFKKRREALGDVSAVNLEPDDGLTPGERNVRASVAREKAAKQAKDIELDEAAHIMADQVALLEKQPRLAHEVLPKEAFTRPVSVADSASSLAPASSAMPASAGSSH